MTTTNQQQAGVRCLALALAAGVPYDRSVLRFSITTVDVLLCPSQQTLMDVLAGRKTGGTISGEVHVNGELSG